jgi:hypothetical protein
MRLTVSVSVLVDIVLGDRLAPLGSALKLDVLNVDSSVDNVCTQSTHNEQGRVSV